MNKLMFLSYLTAKTIGWTYDGNYQSVKVTGCGMDMGFQLVYTLAQALFNDGYALKQRAKC